MSDLDDFLVVLRLGCDAGGLCCLHRTAFERAGLWKHLPTGVCWILAWSTDRVLNVYYCPLYTLVTFD